MSASHNIGSGHAYERGASSAGRTHRGAPLFTYMRLRMWMTPPFWGGDVGAGAAPTCAGSDGTTLRHMRHSMSPIVTPTPWIGVYAMKGVARAWDASRRRIETNTQVDVRPGFAVPGQRCPSMAGTPAFHTRGSIPYRSGMSPPEFNYTD